MDIRMPDYEMSVLFYQAKRYTRNISPANFVTPENTPATNPFQWAGCTSCSADSAILASTVLEDKSPFTVVDIKKV